MICLSRALVEAEWPGEGRLREGCPHHALGMAMRYFFLPVFIEVGRPRPRPPWAAAVSVWLLNYVIAQYACIYLSLSLSLTVDVI